MAQYVRGFIRALPQQQVRILDILFTDKPSHPDWDPRRRTPSSQALERGGAGEDGKDMFAINLGPDRLNTDTARLQKLSC